MLHRTKESDTDKNGTGKCVEEMTGKEMQSESQVTKFIMETEGE
jgi:hypothetical protein